MPNVVAARHGGDVPAPDRRSSVTPSPLRGSPAAINCSKSGTPCGSWLGAALCSLLLILLTTGMAWAQTAAPGGGAHAGGGEASLVVPDLKDPSIAQFFGMPGSNLLMMGLIVCVLGMVFGMVVFAQLRNAPVHQSMREISELIYETCKTYLVQQLKFIAHPRALHRRDHRRLLRRLPALLRRRQDASGPASSCSSPWSASPAAPPSPGSASA